MLKLHIQTGMYLF